MWLLALTIVNSALDARGKYLKRADKEKKTLEITKASLVYAARAGVKLLEELICLHRRKFVASRSFKACITWMLQ